MPSVNFVIHCKWYHYNFKLIILSKNGWMGGISAQNRHKGSKTVFNDLKIHYLIRVIFLVSMITLLEVYEKTT